MKGGSGMVGRPAYERALVGAWWRELAARLSHVEAHQFDLTDAVVLGVRVLDVAQHVPLHHRAARTSTSIRVKFTDCMCRATLNSVGNETVPKIIVNDTINLFFKLQSAF